MNGQQRARCDVLSVMRAREFNFLNSLVCAITSRTDVRAKSSDSKNTPARGDQLPIFVRCSGVENFYVAGLLSFVDTGDGQTLFVITRVTATCHHYAN